MGQYYVIANLDKKEFIHPHQFGDGLKAVEFSSDGAGSVMQGLAVLLVNSDNRGGGDFSVPESRKIAGRWAGNRIVIAGDYAEAGDPGEPTDGITREYNGTHHLSVYNRCDGAGLPKIGVAFTDISREVIHALMDQGWLREEIRETAASGDCFAPRYLQETVAAYKPV